MTTPITFPIKPFIPFIFIDTLFEHKRESFFVMGLCENKRAIHLTESTLKAEKEQQLLILRELIRAHYKGCSGELSLWGKIHYYKYFIRPKQAWVFDVAGEFLYASKEDLPDRATAHIPDKGDFELV